MIQKIVSSINETLKTAFGPDIRIYTEAVEQGLKKPCFFVTCIEFNPGAFNIGRQSHKHTIAIEYLPGSKDRRECYAVLQQLHQVVDVIKIDDDWIRGSRPSGHVDGDGVHFIISYNVPVYYVEDKADSMENIEYKQKGDAV